MTEAVKTRPVAEGVIRELNLGMSSEDFLKDLSVEQIPSTQFIEISYTDPNPRRVQQVANTIGEEFSRQVAKVSPSTSSITATVWERATLPEDPVSPNILLNTLVAVMAGAMLGVGLAFLLEYLDDSWHSPEEAEQISGVPTLAAVPRFNVPKGKKGKG
jgi:capsular polysaccharide biosynthesis protein